MYIPVLKALFSRAFLNDNYRIPQAAAFFLTENALFNFILTQRWTIRNGNLPGAVPKKRPAGAVPMPDCWSPGARRIMWRRKARTPTGLADGGSLFGSCRAGRLNQLSQRFSRLGRSLFPAPYRASRVKQQKRRRDFTNSLHRRKYTASIFPCEKPGKGV